MKTKRVAEVKVAGAEGVVPVTAPVVAAPEKPKLGRAEAIRASLNAIIEKALAPFTRPFKCIGTEEGAFVSINGRKGKLAYVVADVNGKTFKVGLTQMKEIGVEPPEKPKKEPVVKVAAPKKAKAAATVAETSAATGVGGAVLPD